MNLDYCPNSYIEIFPQSYEFELPKEMLAEVVIVESVTQMFPSLHISFIDVESTILDEEGIANIATGLGVNPGEEFYCEWSIVSMAPSGILLLKEPGMQTRIMRGIPVYGLAMLLDSPTCGYGEKSASEVVKEVISRYRFGNKLNIQPSRDKAHYIQPGWNDVLFLDYLADKAGGYLVWSDLRFFKDTGADVRFNFVNPTKLAEQPVKHEILFTSEAGLLDEARRKGGKIKSGEYVAFGFNSKYATLFNVRYANQRFAWANTEKLLYKRDEKTIDNWDFPIMGRKDQRGQYDPIEAMLKGDGWYSFVDLVNGKMQRLDSLPRGTDEEALLAVRCKPQRGWYKRFISVLAFGNLAIRLGDKVKVTVPLTTRDKMFMESVSGEWIVTKMAHVVTFPALHYITRVEMARDEYLGV